MNLGKLAIVAPGLLGSSLGMAAASRGLCRRVSAWARRPEARRQLAAAAWVDEAPDTIEDACRDSDFVALCAPVERIIELAETIAPCLERQPIVTDVGSVKSELSRRCHAALRERARFVGSHPMAGSEKKGFANASANLFEGRICFVTPFADTDAAAAAEVGSFWRALGMSVVEASPEDHDAIVARVSHLPHLVASALASCLAKTCPDAKDHCGNGLRDTTRIASGDPQLWREIIAQNRSEILRALDAMHDELQRYYAAIANEDDFKILDLLSEGKAFRDRL